ncbi:MAG: alkylhydroperoxidase like protein AhpD family [Pseudonocardiales bacterium]|nr:alkylhydroperoxidase like protein AhpD family [Pseudonocardiales bacterium]
MGWLTETESSADASSAGWTELTALAPDGFARLVELHQLVWTLVDPVVLELARLRIAQLIGADYMGGLRSERATAAGLAESKIIQLRQWPASPDFTERDRACLTLAEQFVIDVNGTTDDQTEAVLQFLDPAELLSYVNAIWMFEQLQRLCLFLEVEPTAAEIGLTQDASITIKVRT